MVHQITQHKRKRVSFASATTPSSPLLLKSTPTTNNTNNSKDQPQQRPLHVETYSCCHYYCDGLDKEERKAICWYSPEDLQPCRDEAKDAIAQLQSSLEQGTLDSLSEDSVCLRGIEKYADAAGKYRKQRMYIESILQQQRTMMIQEQQARACEDPVENLANLSRYLSQASTELALFYAGRCAAELSLLRFEEEEEEESGDEEDDEDEYYNEEDSSCTSQMEVLQSKVAEVCVDPPSLSSPKRNKRSRCLAFGDMNSIPPRKIQCCE